MDHTSRRALGATILGAALGAALALGTLAAAPEDPAAEPAPLVISDTPSAEETAPPAPPLGIPTPVVAQLPSGLLLTCERSQALVLGAPGREGFRFTCTVTGGAAEEASFDLYGALAGSSPALPTLPLDPFCSGTLQEGTGVCSRNVIAEVGYLGGTLTVSGTLQPSGRPVGPARVVFGTGEGAVATPGP